MSIDKYGALPEEWEAFTALAKPDLLPYLADPRTPMHPKSRVAAGNKTPGYVKPDCGLGIGMVAWTSHVTTDDDINSWKTDPRHGICLICRTYRAIDIDVPDPIIAGQIEGFTREFLGVPGLMMPMRTRADSGKRMLLYRIADVSEQLRKFQFPLTQGRGQVEFLFDKQQAVVAGRHPSGARYEWPEGLPTPDTVPMLDMDQVRELIRELKAHFAKPDFSREWGETRVPVVKRSERSNTQPSDDPVVQYLVENDWLIDYAEDGGVYVRCPWQHKHNSETKYDAAKYFPAGLNRADPGFNCFHGDCQGRDHHQFLDEIGYTAAEFPLVAEQPKHVATRPSFTYRGKSGQIESTLDNVVKMLEWSEGSGIDLFYDNFRDSTMYRIEDSGWMELDDDAYTAIRLQLSSRGMEPTLPKHLVPDAVSFVARKQQRDSAQEWLAAQHWDGVSRIESFHVDALRLSNTDYHQAVCEYLWTALAGRVLEPGVKADMVPILTGPQGLRKSTLVEVIAPTFNEFVAINLSERDDNLARKLRGKLIAEWGEMRGLETKEAEAIKDWITQRADEWIPKYKEFGTVRMRRFVIVGTDNRSRMLNDPSGARRYLPLTVSQMIDTDYVVANRNQLWAEAALRYRSEGVLWQRADQLAEPARQAATAAEVWTPAIGQWLGEQRCDGHTTLDILTKGVLIPVSQANRFSQERVRRAMLSLGWQETPDGLWVSDLA